MRITFCLIKIVEGKTNNFGDWQYLGIVFREFYSLHREPHDQQNCSWKLSTKLLWKNVFNVDAGGLEGRHSVHCNFSLSQIIYISSYVKNGSFLYRENNEIDFAIGLVDLKLAVRNSKNQHPGCFEPSFECFENHDVKVE